jgi:hypothetical protein
MKTTNKFEKMQDLILRLRDRVLLDDDIDLLIKKFVKNKSKYTRLVEILHRPQDIGMSDSDVSFITEGFGWNPGEYLSELRERIKLQLEELKK